MHIERSQLVKSYPIEGLKALAEAVRYNRERSKPDWLPYGIRKSKIDSAKYQALLEKERTKKWSQDLLVDIINREFGLAGDNRITRPQIRYLENPREGLNRFPNQVLLHYLGSLELVRTGDGQHYYTGFGLDLIAQGLLDWKTGQYLSEQAQEQVLAQKVISSVQKWLQPAAQVQ